MIGRRLGTYEIVEQIGAGGMGEVYRAIRADDQYRKQVGPVWITPTSRACSTGARLKRASRTL
jgi:serine/threonine protein kinase